MNKKLIITNYNEGIATALYHNQKAVELSWNPVNQETLLGNIYIGKVANIVKNINAAFIEIEGRIPCYFSLEKQETPFYTKKGSGEKLAPGDELLVQVSREAVKTKSPSVTSQISLSGKYLVLTYGKNGIGYSSKLDRSQRERIAPYMESCKREMFGWIVRTNAASASETEILSDAHHLLSKMEDIMNKARYRNCRTCMYRTLPEYLSQIKNFYSSDYDEILTDDPMLFENLTHYLQETQPEDSGKLRMYQDHMLPLANLYSLSSAFEEALRERVWLKSGGYLVIQPTEALTVVDVNTGKFDGKKKLQETFLKINMEAAKEAARQMRLRNLSGIIIIDFINMESEEHKKQLLRTLEEYLRKDPKKAVLVDMTPLGLVEITRKREQKSLREKMQKISIFS